MRWGVGARGRVGERVGHERGVAVVADGGAGPSRGEGGPGFEGVDAACDPLGPTGVVLVAQGVGQGLHGVVAVDDVAVAVEPGVDLDQGQCAVAGEDEQAGLAELDAAEGEGALAGRREGWATDGGWAPAALPGHGGPELVADVDQAVPHGQALVGAGHHGLLEGAQPGEELVPLDLEGEAGGGGEAGDAPVGEEGPGSERVGAAVQAGVPVGGARGPRGRGHGRSSGRCRCDDGVGAVIRRRAT